MLELESDLLTLPFRFPDCLQRKVSEEGKAVCIKKPVGTWVGSFADTQRRAASSIR